MNDPAELGLRVGEEVRFRRRANQRWRRARVHSVERDGSVRVHDDDGAALALPLASIQVRKGAGWEPALARAERPEQLGLW